MGSTVNEEQLANLLHDRLFGRPDQRALLESLIDKAGLYRSLLNLPTHLSVAFRLEKAQPDAGARPTFDRLVLVIPESFEAECPVRISGHFMVTYKHAKEPLPNQVPAFRIIYAAVMITGTEKVLFRNEQVRLA